MTKHNKSSIPLFAIRSRIIFPSSSQKNSISFAFCFVIYHIFIVLNVSRYYLSHAFKKSTGYGLWNYVISKRLVYSQKLLAEGASVTEACYESGFKDYAHFIKSFTKTFGCSPKQYGKSDDSIYMVKLNL